MRHLLDTKTLAREDALRILETNRHSLELEGQKTDSVLAGLGRTPISDNIIYPHVVETTHRGERSWDIFSRLLKDRYIVLVRQGHPFTRKRRVGASLLAALRELEFVAVRSHADTLRIVQQLQLEDRLRLVTEHFMVLPSIVRATDLAAIMPRNVARGFEGGYAIVEPAFPQRDFTVALHWSRRFEDDPGNRWLRALAGELFKA